MNLNSINIEIINTWSSHIPKEEYRCLLSKTHFENMWKAFPSYSLKKLFLHFRLPLFELSDAEDSYKFTSEALGIPLDKLLKVIDSRGRKVSIDTLKLEDLDYPLRDTMYKVENGHDNITYFSMLLKALQERKSLIINSEYHPTYISTHIKLKKHIGSDTDKHFLEGDSSPYKYSYPSHAKRVEGIKTRRKPSINFYQSSGEHLVTPSEMKDDLL